MSKEPAANADDGLVDCRKDRVNQTTPMNNQLKSTYASLARLGERGRETSWGLNSINRIAKRLRILAFGLALLISTKPARADDALTARNKEIVRDFYTRTIERNATLTELGADILASCCRMVFSEQEEEAVVVLQR